MAKIGWREEFSVGNAAIDAQHRAILALLNEYFECTDKVRIPTLFARFVSEIDRHFAFEEALMVRHAYPRLETHRQEHARIRAAVMEFAGARWEDADAGRVRAHLYRWIAEHVLSEEHDRDFVAHLRRRGVYVVAQRG